MTAKSGNHIKAWRHRRQLTQAQVAEAIGTTSAVISLLESGDRRLSPKWLHPIAEALGTSAGALLDFEPSDDRVTLLKAWAAIPESQRAMALDILAALAGS